MLAGSMITVCGVPATGNTEAGAVATGETVTATGFAPVFRNDAKVICSLEVALTVTAAVDAAVTERATVGPMLRTTRDMDIA